MKNNTNKKTIETIRTTPVPRSDIADPLDAMEISDDQMTAAIIEATTSTALGTLASFIPPLGRLIEWSEKVDQGVKEQKLHTLLRKYSERFSSQAETVTKLKFLTATTSGKVLLSKVIRLLDNMADEESIDLLANTLKNITNSEIEKKFEEHTYILSQIDRLTPQALVILSRYEDWKDCSLSGTTTTSKHTVLGDWDSQIALFLAGKIGVTASDIKLRMAHSFWELESTGMVVLEGSFVKLEIIGAEVYRYIKK
jgi:hypothetical protein